MYYLPLLTSFSDLFCVNSAPSSPYAGSPTGRSYVPPSGKPSAEGTTVCLSSDSVQIDVGNFWYFVEIQTWDASVVYVDEGGYGEVKVDFAVIRQYRSAKQCSSIQPGTKSSLPSSLAVDNAD
jgi:hypothetical protein